MVENSGPCWSWWDGQLIISSPVNNFRLNFVAIRLLGVALRVAPMLTTQVIYTIQTVKIL